MEPWGGNHLRTYTNLSVINRSKGPGTRSCAVTGYLKPVMERKKLKTLTGVYAEKLILENESSFDAPRDIGPGMKEAGEVSEQSRKS
jgi:hypothetical protein